MANGRLGYHHLQPFCLWKTRFRKLTVPMPRWNHTPEWNLVLCEYLGGTWTVPHLFFRLSGSQKFGTDEQTDVWRLFPIPPFLSVTGDKIRTVEGKGLVNKNILNRDWEELFFLIKYRPAAWFSVFHEYIQNSRKENELITPWRSLILSCVNWEQRSAPCTLVLTRSLLFI